MFENHITKPRYYDGIFWSIATVVCMCFSQARFITPIVGIMSIIMCAVYLAKNNDKKALQIIGIVISAIAILLVAGYYLHKLI